MATLSTLPKLGLVARWTCSGEAPQRGVVKAEMSSGGVTVDVDVADVDSRSTGHPSLRYKTEIPQSVLTALPCRHLEFDVPAG